MSNSGFSLYFREALVDVGPIDNSTETQRQLAETSGGRAPPQLGGRPSKNFDHSSKSNKRSVRSLCGEHGLLYDSFKFYLILFSPACSSKHF